MTNDKSIFTRLDSIKKASINMTNNDAVRVKGISKAVIIIIIDEGLREMKIHDI